MAQPVPARGDRRAAGPTRADEGAGGQRPGGAAEKCLTRDLTRHARIVCCTRNPRHAVTHSTCRRVSPRNVREPLPGRVLDVTAVDQSSMRPHNIEGWLCVVMWMSVAEQSAVDGARAGRSRVSDHRRHRVLDTGWGRSQRRQLHRRAQPRRHRVRRTGQRDGRRSVHLPDARCSRAAASPPLRRVSLAAACRRRRPGCSPPSRSGPTARSRWQT